MEDFLLEPTELEFLLGRITVILKEEFRVDKQINNNKPKVDEYICQKGGRKSSSMSPDPEKGPLAGAAGEESEISCDSRDGDSTGTSEEKDLGKKIFRVIALHCHPDKVSDPRLHKLFLLGKKAQDQKDFFNLLLVLSKLSVLSEFSFEQNEYELIEKSLQKREEDIAQKKKTCLYNWETMTDEAKEDFYSRV
jgi:hypothetical protein